jgi:hypothetical protein
MSLYNTKFMQQNFLSTTASARLSAWVFLTHTLLEQITLGNEYIVTYLPGGGGGTHDENNGFWIGRLDLLTPSFTVTLNYSQYKLYLLAIQRYRWFINFTVHRCTRTRILHLQ